MGWAFDGTHEFAALAAPYLTEGAALGERLFYVAEDPEPDDMAQLADIVDADALQISSIAEIYGDGAVDPFQQHRTYTAALDDALAAGYTGIRVAADVTSRVIDEERLKTWIDWEIVADRMISEQPFTALCAFDKERVGSGTLRHLSAVHPLSSASGPVPPFRLFSAGGTLYVEGQVDSAAITQLWLALENLTIGTDVLVDLGSARLMSRGVLAGLSQLCASGVDVTIRGERGLIEELRKSVAPPHGNLVLEEA